MAAVLNTYLLSWCWEDTLAVHFCRHRFDRNQQHFPRLYLLGSSTSTDALSFSHMPNGHFSNLPAVKAQCSHCFGTFASRTMWMEAVAVSRHWSEGRGGGVASVAMTLYYLWQGSRGERWKGPSRHYKEPELSLELPAELSLIGQTFKLVYVCCKGVGSPHKLKLQGLESLSCFERLDFPFAVLSRGQGVWHWSQSSIKERDCGGDSLSW